MVPGRDRCQSRVHQGRGRVAHGRTPLLSGHVREQLRNASAELYFVVSAAVSVLLALVAAQFPVAAFGSFRKMAAILVVADMVIYILSKLGILKVPRGRIG